MSELVLRSHRDGVTTLTMNNPRKLNGWTESMMAALQTAMTAAAGDPDTQALIITGADPTIARG